MVFGEYFYSRRLLLNPLPPAFRIVLILMIIALHLQLFCHNRWLNNRKYLYSALFRREREREKTNASN